MKEREKEKEENTDKKVDKDDAVNPTEAPLFVSPQMTKARRWMSIRHIKSISRVVT